MNYPTFRGWLDSSVIDDDQWGVITAEDEEFDYSNAGVGHRNKTSPQGNEVQVYTSSTASNADNDSDN